MFEDLLVLTFYPASCAYLVAAAISYALLVDPDVVGVRVGDVAETADEGSIDLLISMGFALFFAAHWLVVMLSFFVFDHAEVLVRPRVETHPN